MMPAYNPKRILIEVVMMTDFAINRQQVTREICQICEDVGRTASDVQLLAVSKKQLPAAIRALHAAGQVAFGENYLQEALSKQAELADLSLEWHFIGQIQRNKTRDIACHFDWVHGVDRVLIAERLSAQRGEGSGLSPLNLCLQVNIDQEVSKGGCLPAEVPELVAAISRLPYVALRGLMVIPEAGHKDAFVRTHALFESARSVHADPQQWDTLSMGMSGDFAEAIAAGATIVRIGTALFGARI